LLHHKIEVKREKNNNLSRHKSISGRTEDFIKDHVNDLNIYVIIKARPYLFGIFNGIVSYIVYLVSI